MYVVILFLDGGKVVGEITVFVCVYVCGIANVCISARLSKNVCGRSVLMFPKGLAQTGQTPKARGNKEDLCVKSALSWIAKETE